jgi:zinc protease
MSISVVGDKELIKPGLERLGYEIVELDKNGNLVPAIAAPAPATVVPVSDAPAGAASPSTEKKKKKK